MSLRAFPIITICLFVLCLSTNAQQASSLLHGRWKLRKIEFAGENVFDLDNLTDSYKTFFKRQKEKANPGKLTENDSLHIIYLFEKTVNDVSKMFFRFTKTNTYFTNKYSKTGELTDD